MLGRGGVLKFDGQQQNFDAPGSARALSKLIGSSGSAAAGSGRADSDSLHSPSIMSQGIHLTLFI